MTDDQYDNSQKHKSPHDCLEEMTIEWSDKPKFGDMDVVFEGTCTVCGRKFEDVFLAYNIIEKETGECVHEY